MSVPDQQAAVPRPSIAAVVPVYRERRHVAQVLARFGPEVARIYVVDDGCPERTGEMVRESCTDPRVTVLCHERNRGVGAATMTGYVRALADGAEVVVKVDGDGQMDPGLIPTFVAPILRGEADYVKGNRFHNLDGLASMPPVRLLGNAVLSFVTKISTGYWNVFDPNNGFTAIHAAVLRELPLDRIDERFFFESDVLFRLNTLQAVVCDVPMRAVYRSEQSKLSVRHALVDFSVRHARNAVRRVVYNYYLRNFNVASLQILFGSLLLAFGATFGTVEWARSLRTGEAATTGTVMLAALPVLLGVQLLLAFASYDMASVPTRAIHTRLGPPRD